MGLTAFGQTSIQPIGREIRGKDTITLFAISSEREILYRLYVGEHCYKESLLMQDVISVQDSLIHAMDSVIRVKEVVIDVQQGIIDRQRSQVEARDNSIQQEKDRLRRWKIGSIGVSGALILLILIL